MTQETLTKVEATLLHLIQQFWQDHGYPPTHRQLARMRGTRHWTIQCTLSRLARKGYVIWDPGASRTLRVTARGPLPKSSPNGSEGS